MNVTFSCPHCEKTSRAEVSLETPNEHSGQHLVGQSGEHLVGQSAGQSDEHLGEQPSVPYRSLDPHLSDIECEHCRTKIAVPKEALKQGRISCCLVCPSKELFVRKDFPQRLGVTIVFVGLAASCIPWYFSLWYATYAILFATAFLDVVLYLTMGNVLECYRCHAQYRNVQGLEDYDPFELEVYEKHRQQAARMANSQRGGHTGNQTIVDEQKVVL